MHIELKILQTINGYRNTAQLICEFTCDDDKNKYNAKIINQIRFCGNGSNKLHFFVYEYIAHGDVSDFLRFPYETHVIKSIILQVACIIMFILIRMLLQNGFVKNIVEEAKEIVKKENKTNTG